MNKRSRIIKQSVHTLDAICVLGSFILGIWLWNYIGREVTSTAKVDFGYVIRDYLVFALLIPFLLGSTGFYTYARYQKVGLKFLSIVYVSLGGLVLFSLVAVLFKIAPHRPTLLIGSVLSVFSIILRDRVTFFLSRSLLKNSKSLLLIGDTEQTAEWWASVQEEDKLYYKNLGICDLAQTDTETLQNRLEESSVELVIIMSTGNIREKLSKATQLCEDLGVEVWIAPNYVQSTFCRPELKMFNGASMLVLRSTPALSWQLIIKTLMDKVLAVIALIISLPLWAMTAVTIKLQSPGPVFYRQDRAGKYGKSFKMWKFRTMVVDAESKLEDLKKESVNEMSGPVFKLENDPRVFKFGHLLRKYSIDELPQLLNVISGEMSLVGPRPMAVYELPEIKKSTHRRKLSVKPGMTCIWQVKGRNQITSFEEWVALDLKYIDEWSIWLDIVLLLKTIPAVLLGKGAK